MLPLPDASPKIRIPDKSDGIKMTSASYSDKQLLQGDIGEHFPPTLLEHCSAHFILPVLTEGQKWKSEKSSTAQAHIPGLPPVPVSCSFLWTQAPFHSINSFPVATPFLQNNSSTPRLTDLCYYHFFCHMSPGWSFLLSPGKRSRHTKFVAIGKCLCLCTFLTG